MDNTYEIFITIFCGLILCSQVSLFAWRLVQYKLLSSSQQLPGSKQSRLFITLIDIEHHLINDSCKLNDF